MAEQPSTNFENELENADLNTLKHSISWRLRDICLICEDLQLDIPDISESVGIHEKLRGIVRELSVLLPTFEQIQQKISEC